MLIFLIFKEVLKIKTKTHVENWETELSRVCKKKTIAKPPQNMKNMFNFPSTTIRKIKISHQLNFQKFEKHTQLAQLWGNRLSCVAVKYCI